MRTSLLVCASHTPLQHWNLPFIDFNRSSPTGKWPEGRENWRLIKLRDYHFSSWKSCCIVKDILVLNCRKCVLFLSAYSDKKVLNGSNQSHVSNIAARHEVPTTSWNIFFKAWVRSCQSVRPLKNFCINQFRAMQEVILPNLKY